MVQLKVIRGGALGCSGGRQSGGLGLRIVEGGRTDRNSFDLTAAAGGAWFDAAAAGARFGVMVALTAYSTWYGLATPAREAANARQADARQADSRAPSARFAAGLRQPLERTSET